MPGFNDIAQEVIDMIIDAAADSFKGEDRRDVLSAMSLTCKQMLPQARVRLFKGISFYGNSGRPGLNGWCDYRDGNQGSLKLQAPTVTKVVKEITYLGLLNDGGSHRHAEKYLKEFTSVDKLHVGKDCKNWNDIELLEPAVGRGVGTQIRFLRLSSYILNANGLVSYLFLFPRLEYLEMIDICIKDGAFQPGTQSLPEFKGVLRLAPWREIDEDFYGFLEMLASLPTDMKYSHIILGHGADEGSLHDCLGRFLLKSEDTLKCLDIYSESILAHIGCAHVDPVLGDWGPVDLTSLGRLKKVAIHLARYDPISAWEIIQNLPLNRIDLLLVVHPDLLDPNESEKYSQGWNCLDLALASYVIVGRSKEKPLPSSTWFRTAVTMMLI